MALGKGRGWDKCTRTRDPEGFAWHLFPRQVAAEPNYGEGRVCVRAEVRAPGICLERWCGSKNDSALRMKAQGGGLCRCPRC